LAIVDVATGVQPMFNGMARSSLSINGEIFNHTLVRPELEAAGHRFATDHSDTETLIHGYEQWGAQQLDRFPRHVFFRALEPAHAAPVRRPRPPGIKPFYLLLGRQVIRICQRNQGFSSSTLRSRLNLKNRLVAEYLAFGYLSDERTMFPQHQEAHAGPSSDVGRGSPLHPH